MPSWSPWGILVVPVFLGPVGQSIPAAAGEPRGSRPSAAARAVYPRACGGTTNNNYSLAAQDGLSPRPRGNRRRNRRGGFRPRSIPAPAGAPPVGLSPRLRGNRVLGADGLDLRGSIPAPAGEPGVSGPRSVAVPVYPRACGGTGNGPCESVISYGLSPRLRGNLHHADKVTPEVRSIPAPAGEPTPAGVARFTGKVYPRACGGTCRMSTKRWRMQDWGLSPRLRGNRAEVRQRQPPGRKVYPRACGGTDRATFPWALRKVYPRACGGTSRSNFSLNSASGLSPRLRGNPLRGYI